MAVPKKKVSKARRDKRRSNNSKLSMPGMNKCSNPACDAFVKNHCVCKVCGFYNGKQVLEVQVPYRKKWNSPEISLNFILPEKFHAAFLPMPAICCFPENFLLT